MSSRIEIIDCLVLFFGFLSLKMLIVIFSLFLLAKSGCTGQTTAARFFHCLGRQEKRIEAIHEVRCEESTSVFVREMFDLLQERNGEWTRCRYISVQEAYLGKRCIKLVPTLNLISFGEFETFLLAKVL